MKRREYAEAKRRLERIHRESETEHSRLSSNAIWNCALHR
jgi:hypothetical protein